MFFQGGFLEQHPRQKLHQSFEGVFPNTKMVSCDYSIPKEPAKQVAGTSLEGISVSWVEFPAWQLLEVDSPHQPLETRGKSLRLIPLSLSSNMKRDTFFPYQATPSSKVRVGRGNSGKELIIQYQACTDGALAVLLGYRQMCPCV